MTAIAVPIASGSGGGDLPLARNEHGEATALAPLATATLVSMVAGSALFRGFYVYGTVEAICWLEVDGTPLAGYRKRINSIEHTATVIIPNPEPYASPTAVVELKVLNDQDVSGDFSGALLGQ